MADFRHTHLDRGADRLAPDLGALLILAERVLDAVLFLNTQHTRFRESLESIEGWHKQKGKRTGRWFFVPFSGSAGESGDSMVHAFRTATMMTSKGYDDLFVYRSDLVSLKPGPDDTVVLIDDFCGSGNQACGFWKIFDELLAERPRIILMLVAATQRGPKQIADETRMDAMCGTILRSKDNVFDPDCTHFSTKEIFNTFKPAEHSSSWLCLLRRPELPLTGLGFDQLHDIAILDVCGFIKAPNRSSCPQFIPDPLQKRLEPPLIG